MVASGILPLKSLHVHRMEPHRGACIGNGSSKVNTVDKRASVIAENKAGTSHRVGHTLVAAKLSATRNAVFQRVLIEIEVTVGGTHYLMARPVVTCGHAERVFL